MPVIDEQQAVDLLTGDTDPRQVALFLVQQGLTMDPQERDQRLTVLNALNTHATGQMARETAALARHTQDLANQTRRMAWFTLAVAIAAVVALGTDIATRIW